MPFLQIKNFFLFNITVYEIFKLVGAFSNVLSKPEIFRLMGKVCLYIVLFLIIGNCNDSVRLGNMSK